LLAGDPFDRPTGWPHEPDSIPSPHGSGAWSSGCRPDCTRINLEPLGRDTLRAAEAVTGMTIRRSGVPFEVDKNFLAALQCRSPHASLSLGGRCLSGRATDRRDCIMAGIKSGARRCWNQRGDWSCEIACTPRELSAKRRSVAASTRCKRGKRACLSSLRLLT
jgi:hypothetical protein